MLNLDEFEPAKQSPAGDRYCSNCSLTKNSQGGYWKIIANGKNRRWLCSSCMNKKLDGKK
jgi:hypothetical protein